jgi:hypothetical protein
MGLLFVVVGVVLWSRRHSPGEDRYA